MSTRWERVTVTYELDVFAEQADLSDPVAVARAAYAQITAPDGMLPILTVQTENGPVDVDLEEVGHE